MQIRYEDYQKLICKLAHKYSLLTGIEFDELLSAGNEKFVTCQKTYDSNKAKFSTYLTWELRGLFREMQRKQRDWKSKTTLMSEMPYKVRQHGPEVKAQIIIHDNWCEDKILSSKPMQEELVFFKSILKELSSDAKEVVKIVFNTPTEMLKMMPAKQPRGINKHQIQKHLKRKGWTISRIWKSFEEITKAL